MITKRQFIQGKIALLALLFILVLAGCGKSEDAAAPTAEAKPKAEEVTEEKAEEVQVKEEVVEDQSLVIVDSANREVVFEKVPERITTVIGGDMEIIYALGGEVVGRPQVRGPARPPQTAELPDVGYPHEVNFEQLTALQTDLFIGHARLNMKDLATLESLGINVLLTAGDSVEGIMGLIEMYGKILDKNDEATKLIGTIQAKIDEMAAIKREKPVRALIVFGTSEDTMAALPHSLGGNIFEIAGIENVAKDYPKLDKYPNYAQLSIERILEANPDAIYFMAHGDAEAAKNRFESEMAKNPAWKNVTAVKNGNINVLPHALFGSNPGPRITESLDYLKESLDKLEN